MQPTPSIGAPQQVSVPLDNGSRHVERSPEPVQEGTPGVKDTVQLSKEAVTILISGDDVAANLEVIDASNGVGRALLNQRR